MLDSTAACRTAQVVSARRAGHIVLLHDFILGRLVDGNVSTEPKQTEEAPQVLRGLLEAWQELASRPASALIDAAPEPELRPALGATFTSSSLIGASSFVAGGACR